MGDEEVRQVGGGEMVEGFKGEEEYLENYALFDGEPVERVENWSDVFTGPGVGKEAGSRVLDIYIYIYIYIRGCARLFRCPSF